MELTRNYETIYFCRQLLAVKGRRYNIKPKLEDGMEPEIKGYVYKETMAGFFRAWELNEIHLGLTAKVNELRVAEKSQIINMLGIDENEYSQIIDKCVVMGLLCENEIQFRDEDDINLYMVDTGGIFAFEEAGISYNKVNYTISMDQRLKIYRKNIYLIENNLSEKEAVNVHFLEDILGLSRQEKYLGGTLLVDMGIAEKLGLTEQIKAEIIDMVRQNSVRTYDTGKKKYIDIK